MFLKSTKLAYQLKLFKNVCVFFLCEGAQVNAARLHETALHHAAKANNLDMIELLVEFGANIYARDKHDKKPVNYTRPDTPAAHCLQLCDSEFNSKSHEIFTGSVAFLGFLHRFVKQYLRL